MKARPVVVSDLNVWDAALNRLRWLFDEFDGNVHVSSSGGKDSTVVIELALIIAKEKGCLPLKVHFLDQECEFQATVDYQRYTRDRPEIDMDWYQIPFRLFNAANHEDSWLDVWGEASRDIWIRPREEGSITEPFMKRGKEVDRFHDVLDEINYSTGNGVSIAGVRAEESPARRLTTISKPAYKWATWGSSRKRMKPDTKPKQEQRYTLMHPIYDWSYRDVWKAIHDNGWRYNAHYDHLHQYGTPTQKMRVSSFHHESALGSLLYLQQVEPATWEAATRRLEGINAYGNIGLANIPTRLPYMFASWEEYMHYLIEHLVPLPEYRTKFLQQWERAKRFADTKDWRQEPREAWAYQMTLLVVENDVYGTNFDNAILNMNSEWRRRQEDS